MGANCFGGKQGGTAELPPAKKNIKGGVPINGAGMDRVNDNDKAIIDIKAR